MSGWEKIVFPYLKVGFPTMMYRWSSMILLAKYPELKIEIVPNAQFSSEKVMS